MLQYQAPIADEKMIKRSRIILKHTRGILNEMARGKLWPADYTVMASAMTLIFNVTPSKSSAINFHAVRDDLSDIFRS